MLRLRPLFWAGFWAFLIDQASKYLVVHWMGLSRIRSIDVLPPLLNFRYGENRGINFGLLAGNTDVTRWVLIGLSLVVIAGIILWIRGGHPARRMQLSAGLLIGGALGNVADRLLFGYVRDFLNISCCGFANPFVFNLADVLIFAGAIGLMVFDTGGRGRKKAP
jgi:signal peptidase II